jgi:hypothetical protein
MAKKIRLLMLIAVAATGVNYLVAFAAAQTQIGLYLDTVFTIAAVFSGGLAGGLITAVFSTIIFGIGYAEKIYCLYGLCSAAAAVLTYVFVRAFPWAGRLRITGVQAAEQKQQALLIDHVIMLVLLSLAMCALMSVMGGLISVFIQLILKTPMKGVHVETYFKLALLRQGLSLLPAEIVARIPINIVDRFVSVTGAYGTALFVRGFFTKIAAGNGCEKSV